LSTTAQKVFDIAMGLMDEVSSSGATDTSDTAEYKNRVLFILNALRGELYQYSDTYIVVTDGARPVCTVISALTDTLDLDDFLAQTIMPYGLAAHLLLDENPASASFFQQRYDELLARYGKAIPAVSEDITDVYGGIEYGQFGSW
jgi:hypothetical protein